jgi:predicted nucleic acid-binding protein
MKLVDSTVVIDHLRGRTAATDVLRSAFGSGEPVGASEIVRFEVLAVQNRELEETERFLSTLSWVVVDEQIARLAGWLSRRFRRSHAGIDAPDYLIAATAVALDADLLTTNTKHFPMLEGLAAAY